jgi:hypothetical protein
MSMLSRLTFSTLFIATFLMAQAAQATTYYVSTTGSDGAAGNNINTPWRTIGHAAATMIAGDTTYVRGGTYTTETTIRFATSGTQANPIRLMNYPGEFPVVSWSSKTDPDHRIYIYSGTLTTPVSDIVIQGLEIKNGYEGIKIVMGLRITIRNNSLHDHADNGILATGVNIIVDRNIIRTNGDYTEPQCGGNPLCNQFHGMYITGTGWVITNNLIYDNLAYGIQTAGYPYVVGSFPSAAYAGFTGVIVNNTISYQRNRSAIVIWQQGNINNRIENNIFFQNCQAILGGTNGIELVSSGNGHLIRNNYAYATTSGGTNFISGGTEGVTYTQSGNSINVADPLFVSAGAIISGTPNFSLRSGSPAIDRALTQSLVTVDFSGTPRPQGSAYDIGAYEGNATSDVAAPAPPQGLNVF